MRAPFSVGLYKIETLYRMLCRLSLKRGLDTFPLEYDSETRYNLKNLYIICFFYTNIEIS